MVFAGVVFVYGWTPVSPFASWPLGLILLLAAPAVVPFAILVGAVSGRARRNRVNGDVPSFLASAPRFRWSDVLTTRRAVFAGCLAVLVFVSFFAAFRDYRGSPELVDGQLVFTDHGRILGPATQQDADEARTRESRMFTGHLMLFGVVGLLAQVPPAPTPPTTRRTPVTRPPGRGRARRGRPPAL